MYLDKAVMIPKRKGVSFKSKGDTNYVIYEIGRKYDPEKQYTVPERVQIGIQIPAEPEMMLPNENYLKHFYNEMGNPYEEETGLTGEYETERRKRYILRELFLSTFHEILNLSRREPDEVVNTEKVERLNQLLEPLKEMLQNEEYVELLEVIPLPEATDGKEKMKGLTSGTIWKQVVSFALPLLAASLVQLLYNFVNQVFAGQFIGTRASAGNILPS